MKQKKAHASHPVGNRTVIGIICIVVALAICFGIAPLVNRLSDGKTKIVRLTRDISAGARTTVKYKSHSKEQSKIGCSFFYANKK